MIYVPLYIYLGVDFSCILKDHFLIERICLILPGFHMVTINNKCLSRLSNVISHIILIKPKRNCTQTMLKNQTITYITIAHIKIQKCGMSVCFEFYWYQSVNLANNKIIIILIGYYFCLYFLIKALTLFWKSSTSSNYLNYDCSNNVYSDKELVRYQHCSSGTQDYIVQPQCGYIISNKFNWIYSVLL